jgi:hypothetical protein
MPPATVVTTPVLNPLDTRSTIALSFGTLGWYGAKSKNARD